MAPHSLEKMSQTFTTIHSVTIRLYSLRRYPNYAPVRRCNHIFSLHSDDTYATSPITFACTCASTIPSNMSPRVWHQMSHSHSGLFSCSNPSLINSWWHVPSSRSFSMCRACHVTNHFRLFSCRHNSILQSPPVILYSHCRYTFVFDAIPSFSIPNLPCHRVHSHPFAPKCTSSRCSAVSPAVEGGKGFTDGHGMGIYVDVDGDFHILFFTFISDYYFTLSYHRWSYFRVAEC